MKDHGQIQVTMCHQKIQVSVLPHLKMFWRVPRKCDYYEYN